MNATDILADLRDVADALTNPYQHREPRWTWSASRHKVKLPDHVVILPGLVAQLAELAEIPSSPGGGEDAPTSRPVPQSRPPGNPQALAAYLDIHLGVAKWTIMFGLETRDTVESQIRHLVASVAARDDDDQGGLLDELRRWQRQAEIILEWREADLQLEVPCPVDDCGERALRVNVADKTARCRACGCRWAEEENPERGIYSIGVLAGFIADHKRLSKEGADRAREVERARKAARSGRPAGVAG
jgi:hypothetical protein